MPPPIRLRHQQQLETVLNKLFPGVNIKRNVRSEVQIVRPTTNYHLELDLWIPTLNLAFEFQDPHHYVSTWESNIPLQDVQQKDYFKREAALKDGITLVVVPCWWDGTLPSLVTTIRKERPELLTDFAHHEVPIPYNAPEGFFDGGIPDVGELMLASFVLSSTFSVKSWWMGEKYDGYRVCWHPQNRKLYSRLGAIFYIPDSCTMIFPKVFLDGELWGGRGSFPEYSLFWHTNAWGLRIMAFDNADPETRHKPFEERYGKLLVSVAQEHPFLILAPRIAVTNKHHLNTTTRSILDDSGEGVILRKPHSIYESGRSSSLFKFKAMRADREALVVGIEVDGSYVLKLPDDTIFEAALPIEVEEELRPQIKIGDIVSFSYDKYSRNLIPMNLKIFRIRKDVTWHDVVNNEPLPIVPTQKSVLQHPKGYWSLQKTKNMRLFFKAFAKSRNLSLRHPDGWYSISANDIKKQKGGATLLKRFGNSVSRALSILFPEIKWDPSKFPRVSENYWYKKKRRRKFFEDYSFAVGFDPLVSENWHHVSRRAVESVKNGSTVMGYYVSLADALIDLFPELDFSKGRFSNYAKSAEKKKNNRYEKQCGIDFSEQSKIKSVPRGFWNDKKNHVKFFEEYAKVNRFDPLKASNWYTVSSSDITNFEGGANVLKHFYNGSLTSALVSVFPSIQFEVSKFYRVPQNHWAEEYNRRQVFDQFAATKGFDPFQLSHWDSIPVHALLNCKGGRSALNYYDNSLAKAVSDLYSPSSTSLALLHSI